MPDQIDCRRFIPAGAGNGIQAALTVIGNGCRSTGTVHPRGRGERVASSAGPLSAVHPRGRGERDRSQCDRSRSVHPRGRGERVYRVMSASVDRFIPAGAGNGLPRIGRIRRGDRFIPAGAGNGRRRTRHRHHASGSSPRARGTRASLTASAASRPVHPRGRGERPATVRGRRACSGSSPRARGTGGSSPMRQRPLSGSSPRARGTGHRRARMRQRRFIPAGAGNAVQRRADAADRFIPAGAGNADADDP